MATVTCTVTFTAKPLPSGVTGQGKLRYIITRTSDNYVVITHDSEGAGSPQAFPGINPGAYKVTAQRLSSAGAPIGAIATATFVVPETTYDEPATITVALA